MNVYYSPDYVCSGYGFDTTRKAGWIAESLARNPIDGVELVGPEPLTAAQVMAVHSPEYVRAIESGEPRALAESQGFDWDPGIWPMVLASNGGAVAAALSAMENGVAAGSLSSGLHHARRDTGAGYCTFNGLVIAARAALVAGARSVLILDLDAHCGGGTASLIADEPRICQADVSVDRCDCYPPTARARLTVVTEPANYLGAIRATLHHALAEAGPFDLCIYNAGIDPFEYCGTGGLAGITSSMLEERERLVFEFGRTNHVPVAFVLAGGYTSTRLSEERLVELHRMTITAANPG